MGLIPGSGRSPGGGNGNPLQQPCLENPHGQGRHGTWGHKRGGYDWATTQQQLLGYLASVRAQLLSHVPLYTTPWTVACQTSLSVGFSRQEYWSGLPFCLPKSSSKTGDPGKCPRYMPLHITTNPRGPHIMVKKTQTWNNRNVKWKGTWRHCHPTIRLHH